MLRLLEDPTTLSAPTLIALLPPQARHKCQRSSTGRSVSWSARSISDRGTALGLRQIETSWQMTLDHAVERRWVIEQDRSPDRVLGLEPDKKGMPSGGHGRKSDQGRNHGLADAPTFGVPH